MKNNFRNNLFIFFILIVLKLASQERVVTAGFQFKPIFSSNFFRTGEVIVEEGNVMFNIQPQFGYCFGMVIRKGFTPKISFETAINFVKRNYQLSIRDGSFEGVSNFSIIGYEIPFQTLFFVRLSPKIYMDASGGISLDFFPSDIFTQDTAYFKHKGFRRSWANASLVANLGWEYRTDKSGYFYLGGSYHRPFFSIYESEVTYLPNNEVANLVLFGSYLTIDFRYFFNEKPIKNKKKKKIATE